MPVEYVFWLELAESYMYLEQCERSAFDVRLFNDLTYANWLHWKWNSCLRTAESYL